VPLPEEDIAELPDLGSAFNDEMVGAAIARISGGPSAAAARTAVAA
jgi:hypothetical protein